MSPIPTGVKVLFVGLDPAGAECLRTLVDAGTKHFAILNSKILDAQDLSDNTWLPATSIGQPVAKVIAEWLFAYNRELTIEARVDDPLEIVDKSPGYILSFSLVLTMRVAREVELAIGNILYEAPPRALIISRTDGFHAKMRSQYRIHKVTDEAEGVVLNGIDLTSRPEPPTPEKCDRVRKALEAAVDVSSPEILSWILLVHATGVVFQETVGYPPAHRPSDISLTGHEAQVETLMRNVIAEKDLRKLMVDPEVVRICCANGWGSLPLTSTVMGRLIAGEGIKLLTSTGLPVNTVPANLAAGVALGIAAKI